MSESKGITPLDITSGNVTEKWKFCIQKFKNYLKATESHKKDEDVQCAQLLQFIGYEGIHIFNTFKFKKEEQNEINPLIKEFERFFHPKINLVYERHKFFTRKQLEGETLQQFLIDLKNKARNCYFDDLEDSLVCSILIIGLISDQFRERLSEDTDMNLKKAENICSAVQESKKQGLEMASEVKELCLVPANQSVQGGHVQPSTSTEYTRSPSQYHPKNYRNIRPDLRNIRSGQNSNNVHNR
ncbi:hypothetical protein JTB14_037017 [Gonioctena quinquepunctata]|nr:hypothetical protein JTB14_037017 [Gonioctena quinquepunctata]